MSNPESFNDLSREELINIILEKSNEMNKSQKKVNIISFTFLIIYPNRRDLKLYLHFFYTFSE